MQVYAHTEVKKVKGTNAYEGQLIIAFPLPDDSEYLTQFSHVPNSIRFMGENHLSNKWGFLNYLSSLNNLPADYRGRYIQIYGKILSL